MKKEEAGDQQHSEVDFGEGRGKNGTADISFCYFYLPD